MNDSQDTPGYDVKNVVDDVEEFLSDENYPAIAEMTNKLSFTEVIAALERLNKNDRAIVYRLLEKDLALEVFEELSPALQSDLVDALREGDVAKHFAELDPDDRVWLLDELPAAVAKRLLSGLETTDRAQTANLLGYPEDSVARRMSPQLVTVRPYYTVRYCLERINQHLDDAETIYDLPVIDSGRKVLGDVSLRQLLGAAPDTVAADLMQPAHTKSVDEDAEVVARRTAKHGTMATWIVDSEHRLVGVFTLDDAVRILEQEESEDAARQGGVEPLRRPYLSTPVTSLMRSRIVWLLVLAVGATLTVQVQSVFEGTIEQVTALALFVPLLIGTGGNTGNQAATTVTRALALHDVGPRDLLKVLGRELRVGVLLGLVLGSLGFLLAGLVYDLELGLTIGLTLLAVCTLAASIGGIMPMIARAVKVDPAVFSNPFISTFVDATGLIIYFMIAKTVMGI